MTMTLSGRSVLLIIGGGIAAYKSLELIRLLKQRQAKVTAIMTKAAEQFVTPLSVASLTGEKVYTDLFSLTDEVEMGHIELSRSADLLVVAPATADLMAKMAQGLPMISPPPPARHRQEGPDCARHECAHVAASGDDAQSRHAQGGWRADRRPQ